MNMEKIIAFFTQILDTLKGLFSSEGFSKIFDTIKGLFDKISGGEAE